MQLFATSLKISALTLFLAACSQAPEAGQSNAQAAPADPASQTGTASPAPANAAALWAGGAQRPLDIQSAHPNGVVLQLTSLQSRPTETAIGIRVMNGRDREVSLNAFNRRNSYIVLDSGERLYISPPPGNVNISIPAGQTLEGELVFLGRLPPVNSAILMLNENSSTDNRYSTTPGFRIDLPLTSVAGGTSQ